MNRTKPHNYLEMIESMPPEREARLTGGKTYTCGVLAAAARQKKRALLAPGNSDHRLFVIHSRQTDIQFITFLALSGTRLVPLIAQTEPHVSDLPIPDDACMAVATSGSTGEQKLFFRTFESWYDYFPIQNEIFDMNAESRIFTQGTLAFTGNLNIYLSLLAAGAAILAEEDADPRIWARRMEDDRATGIYLIPSKLRLLETLCTRRRIVNRNIRSILSGSQSLGRVEATALKKSFPMAGLTLYYGASELSYITYIKDDDMGNDRTLVGRPFPGVRVCIREGRFLVTTTYGVIGIGADACIGDCGHQDENGFFYFDGRADDICNIHGRKISTLRVENALLSLPGIREAAVRAVLEGGREYLAAWLVAERAESGSLPTPPPAASSSCCLMSEPEIRRSLRPLLADWEMPRQLHFVSSLPKTDSGKTDYRQLSVR
ncbi:MAG: AMP-binding protein [Clostridiales bacterium]|nr:AMP-binding protein [Clostridiales bacterium]